MSLPERTYRHVDTSRSPTLATMEKFRRGGESSRMSPTYSPTSSRSPSSPYFDRLKHHDPEEDQGFYQRKSVLTKMKEGAKRLIMRNSFSKRRQEDGNLTPSWGVSLEEDDGEEEEDAEYLGAPMYESELAPEALKENARQHPRANPVISEKHVLRSPKSGVEQYQKKPGSPIKSNTTTQAATATLPVSNMKMTENLAQKLTPAYAEESDSNAANSISSKSQGLAVSRTTSSNMSSQTSIAPPNSSAPLSTQTLFSSSLSGRNTSSPKGASVKEYLKIKFEPGNGEKVLSEVISEAMSPRRSTSASTDAGVIDKVRGAMNSLLRNEEPSQQYAVKNPSSRASSQTPSIVSTNLQEVGQEENHGRILQAN